MHVFSGRNGAGKTNILEAIYFLTYGKSFRTHVMTNMINHEAKESIITANYVDNSEYTIRFLQKSEKRFFVDDKEIRSLSSIFGYFQCMDFLQQDYLLISGGPEEKRRFLDLSCSLLVPGYYNTLLKYNRAQAEKPPNKT